MRRTPSFGSDFGGFDEGLRSGDPWGGWGNESKAEDPMPKEEDLFIRETSEPGFAAEDSYGGADDSYGGWGGVRPSSPRAATPQAQEWESAQRSIQIKEARAPHDTVEKLKRGWDEVAAAVIAEKDQLEVIDDDEEQKLDDGVKIVEQHV